MLERSTPDSTFVFYFAGHGNPGQGCTYGGWFDVSEITVALKKQFKGRNVLLMADCCYVDRLGVVANDLAASG